jgi:hypothetical protein
MKYAADRPFADPEKAARRILEIANAVEPVQGRIHFRHLHASGRGVVRLAASAQHYRPTPAGRIATIANSGICFLFRRQCRTS